MTGTDLYIDRDSDVEVEILPAPVVEGGVSPYQAAKVVNGWLAADGVEKVLPPQMFYNYTTARIKKGKTPMIPVTEGKISTEDLRGWYVKYLAKQ
jgi:hypothetical protein